MTGAGCPGRRWPVQVLWGPGPTQGVRGPKTAQGAGGAGASGGHRVRAPPACAVLWLSRPAWVPPSAPTLCLQPLPLSSPQTPYAEGAPPHTHTHPLNPARPVLETAAPCGPHAPLPCQPLLPTSRSWGRLHSPVQAPEAPQASVPTSPRTPLPKTSPDRLHSDRASHSPPSERLGVSRHHPPVFLSSTFSPFPTCWPGPWGSVSDLSAARGAPLGLGRAWKGHAPAPGGPSAATVRPNVPQQGARCGPAPAPGTTGASSRCPRGGLARLGTEGEGPSCRGWPPVRQRACAPT